jgi:phenylalanyl-tRNA synthetase beta chain
MFISLNWLKDFVALPGNLDPRELALRFTTTTAEVEGAERVAPNFSGLVAARIEAVRQPAGDAPATHAGAAPAGTAAQSGKFKTVIVDAGRQLTSLTTAPDIKPGDLLIYAPPGASVAGHAVGTTDPLGRPSDGMIVSGQALGLLQVGANAVFLPPRTQPGAAVPHGYEPGQPIDPAPFDDWIIEIDNKSITHRPDCWGHYGIAREVAAILGLPLRPYDATSTAELARPGLPEIPIAIDDARLCPRYTGLLMKGLKSQSAPLWMQVRLALCGMRPISLLVDLTNYIMLELGQPMHAFDGAALPNIQVALAAKGERFTTLDGVTRTMPPGTLMIQCRRKSVAIAGIMGGAATEVSAKTDTVLLESANFESATIRRAATAMGHRTEASARFEKSLDPAHTVLGIARFHKLAQAELPDLQLASTLSDCYPAPKTPPPIELDCEYAGRFIGQAVARDEMMRILTALEFQCAPLGDSRLRVTPPSFRATKDIAIEVDVIEEIARFIGYHNIEPKLPYITARHFERQADLVLEEHTLNHLCAGGEFVEVHGYIWYDDHWLAAIGFDPGPCLTLRNPIAENCSRFRKTLVPGLVAFANQNRHHFDRFQLAEIGSVFEPGHTLVEESQHRGLGLVAAQSGKKADGAVWDHMRTALDGWARQVLESRLELRETKSMHPWEDSDRLAEIVVAGRAVGRITILPLAFKQRIDERLKAWSIAVAELNLTALTDLVGRYEKLPPVPRHPQVRLDFSVLADAAARYAAVERRLGEFRDPLLRRLAFVESYEGGSIPEGKRSLLFRAEIGLDDRTLTDDEIRSFQTAFNGFLASAGLQLRSGA